MKSKLLLLVCLLSSLTAGINDTDEIKLEMLDKISSSRLAQLISTDIAKHLPMQLDVVTTWDSIISYNNDMYIIKSIDTKALKKEYFINLDAQQIEKFKKELYNEDSTSVCNNKNMRYLIVKRNINVRFEYKTEKNKSLFKYSVNKLDCLKIDVE